MVLNNTQGIIQKISKYVKLEKAGNNHKGLCPFHEEKTPSFMVNGKMQIWHCFGCGVGGDIEYFREMAKRKKIIPLIAND